MNLSRTKTSRTLATLALGLVVSALVLFAAISPALAQDTTGPTLQQANGFVQCSSTFNETGSGEPLKSCDLCDIFQLINNATTYAVSFLLGIATVFALVSGFLYLTAAGDEHRVTQAKTTLKFAIVGFIFAMLAAIIVKTIVISIFGGGSSEGLFGTFSCTTEAVESAPGPIGNGGGSEPEPTVPPVSGPPPSTGAGGSDDAIRARLCPTPGAKDCITVSKGVSFTDTKEYVLSSVIDFQKACAAREGTCTININDADRSGTTKYTYSHANGWKLDLNRNPAITNFIENNTRFAYKGIRKGDGARVYVDQQTGNYYANEGSHWDVAYCQYQCTNGVLEDGGTL
jgi:hypothetical protein